MNFSMLEASAFTALPLFVIGVIHRDSLAETVVARGAAEVFPLTWNFATL